MEWLLKVLMLKPIRIVIILAAHAIFFFPRKGRRSLLFSARRTFHVPQLASASFTPDSPLSVRSRLSGDGYLAEMRHSHCTRRLLGRARRCYYTAKPPDHPQAWGPSCVQGRSRGPCCDKKVKLFSEEMCCFDKSRRDSPV